MQIQLHAFLVVLVARLVILQVVAHVNPVSLEMVKFVSYHPIIKENQVFQEKEVK